MFSPKYRFSGLLGIEIILSPSQEATAGRCFLWRDYQKALMVEAQYLIFLKIYILFSKACPLFSFYHGRYVYTCLCIFIVFLLDFLCSSHGTDTLFSLAFHCHQHPHWLQEMGFLDTPETNHDFLSTSGNFHAAVELLPGSSSLPGWYPNSLWPSRGRSVRWGCSKIGHASYPCESSGGHGRWMEPFCGSWWWSADT